LFFKAAVNPKIDELTSGPLHGTGSFSSAGDSPGTHLQLPEHRTRVMVHGTILHAPDHVLVDIELDVSVAGKCRV
jgi:hypothetical protein